MSKRLSGIFTRQPSTSTGAGNNDDFVPPQTPKSMNNLRAQLKRGTISQPSAVAAVVDAVRHKNAIDDRKLLLEHALALISNMEEGSMATAAKNKIIQLFYSDLTHPASTSLGPKFAWRAPDGARNNPDLPDMGRAGTPYSRSVQQTHPLPADQLPDPGLVFDTLLRRESFVEHPGGLSAMMFSFAALVIHSVFRTSHRDVNINETSSYVDLSPLYGHNEDVQKKVRAYNGLGYLHPDTFGEDRLRFLPPAYIAKKLYEINERGTYKDPANLTPDKRGDQDEEIFQTARLVNCGWFGMIVFSDYFSAILGLVRYGNNWSLLPFDEIRQDDHTLYERGKGNVVSVEFNCLYRWHATTSKSDEEWTMQAFRKIFGPDAKPEDFTPEDFKKIAKQAITAKPDPSTWTIGGLERQADGSFRDEDLANVLQNATEDPAARFGARGIPASMRLHEIMGLEQSRAWGVCSLNEFRRFLGLKAFESFSEWNSDPAVAKCAEKLYGNIENLELYVGLQAEEAKPLMEGAGLCPGYTISRAILSDAIALTRGDRFFTHDFTPYNLTAWGFADCQRDPGAFGFGSTMGRLLLRTLPDHYSENSVYTFFPFMTPKSMHTNLENIGVLKQYDLDRPSVRPSSVTFSDYKDVAHILESTADFDIVYKEHASRVIKGSGFYPVEDEKARNDVINALSGSPKLVDSIGRYFYETTQKLILENSFTFVGGETFGIDLIKYVIREVPVHWAATDVAGIQLKTKENPCGEYTPTELFDILSDIYSFIFIDIEPSKVRVLQYKVEKQIKDLLDLIEIHLGVGNRFTINGIIGTVSSFFHKSKRSEEHHEIVKRIDELGLSTDQLANTILAIMVSSVGLSLTLTNIINLYLGSDHDVTLKKLARHDDPQVFTGFVYEGLRLDPAFQGYYRVATKDQTIGKNELKKGDRVFADIGSANLNEKMFSEPSKVDPSRSTSACIFGDGPLRFLGETLTVKITSQVLRAIYAYNNVRRAPGASGKLKRFTEGSHPQYHFAYLDRDFKISPWPTSLTIQYDA
ncbi:hypothetical protein AGABI1DRAFT_90139 [Agaricus bisporus var. burnettii JB137-S8]|uniref:Heme peroxidase n=1 Tax=Agaricus bisporus var. burnettii (strain JB137-S8 / ATCC MYA-4627 / FGSC 10392) TaxID=597362 RepID=K5XEY2_AGABU|nr:uncharacterized protein AGABI1DRAFT_90139 [Agaricus bisporus var. burnettii JB137-S8]EKM81762.1 hypothetical protein AGABI1DRAFT_90139 [Agaricus bisporus var. burnettii JB137-S8]